MAREVSSSSRVDYGQEIGAAEPLRGTGGVAPVGLAGLLKSAEFTFVSVQLEVLIADLRFWSVLVEKGAGPAPS